MHACCDASRVWRREPGSYLLLLALAEPVCLEIGRLGRRTFRPGRYVYLGSALGPGGVAARLNRHLRANKRTHWHIDYLTPAAPIVGTGTVYGPDRCECTWAHALRKLDGATAPVNGFGSSDCRSGCIAHLWRLPDGLPLSWIEDELTRCPVQAI
jgi:Uri superfamily endonuclease